MSVVKLIVWFWAYHCYYSYVLCLQICFKLLKQLSPHLTQKNLEKKVSDLDKFTNLIVTLGDWIWIIRIGNSFCSTKGIEIGKVVQSLSTATRRRVWKTISLNFLEQKFESLSNDSLCCSLTKCLFKVRPTLSLGLYLPWPDKKTAAKIISWVCLPKLAQNSTACTAHVPQRPKKRILNENTVGSCCAQKFYIMTV